MAQTVSDNFPVCDSPPWHFNLAKWLIRNRIRGGFQMIELAERLGWLNLDCRFLLSQDIAVEIPLYRRVNQLALPDVLAYENQLVALVSDQIGRRRDPTIWIDCGADIGLLTALVASKTSRLKEVIAIEPNPSPFEYLQRNLAQLPVPTRAICAAVADFHGRGTLAYAKHDASDHSRFLVADEQGVIDVLRIDDLLIEPNQPLALKIDVEGGEFAVLHGARRTLTAAPDWLVALEAHLDVFRRTGVDPCQCIRFLQTLGNVEIRIAELPDLTLDCSRPYFQQVSQKITNVVCICEK
jgi:FkbM family methyltransferase